MQLLDERQNQQLNRVPTRLKEALEDIVDRLEIESNFCVRHPDYKPIELPEQSIELFQKLPKELQDKYVSSQLQGFLYGVYYNGFLRETLRSDADEEESALQNLENNTFLGVDMEFYERLHESNRGQGYFDAGWKVIREESDGTLAAIKHGLTVHLDRERHLQPEVQSAKVGDLVAIKLPKNKVQNGFYMAIGDAGTEFNGNKDNGNSLVRVYFHLDPEGAVGVMGILTERLNHLSIPFSYKTLYNPSDYKRYDSAVLYFHPSYYDTVKPVLEDIYREYQSHFQEEIPLFTKMLAPGLGLAEEPNIKFKTKESFGTHRCQIVADSLLETWQKGDDSPETRMKAILDNFTRLGIQLEYSYLNAESEDIYPELNLCN
jgi:HopA1 effector protein family